MDSQGSLSAMLRLPLILCAVLICSCRTGRNYPDATGPRYADTVVAIAPRASDTLRVVSFNIEFAREIDAAIALMKADSALSAPDVLLLQEMDSAGAARVARAFGMAFVYYPAIYHKRARRDVGNAVLSRWRIVEDAKLILPHPSRYAGTHRVATAATLLVGDARVRVYSTHLGTPADLSGAEREEQLRAIATDAAPYERVIIAGDMNSGDVGRVLVPAGFCWPTRAGPKTATLGRIDHIFVRGLSASSARSGTGPSSKGVSDHRAIWSVAVLPGGGQATCN
jgi:endonuclease/exonuclease/phosphatase family metal-dependent hydrolase